jgi:hypothetical protein
MRRLLVALCLALPCIAVGQSIYKVQTSDGSILFTDTPPADSKILEERATKGSSRPAGSSATAASRPAPSSRTAPSPRSASSISTAPTAALDAAAQEVAAAETSLQVARRRLDLGREPLPGERRGLAGGGSRLTEEYEARIAGLEREVADAEARLQRARAARNTAR